ncbi:hypothetical protein E3N88_24464 [Mikania micrantha]|uniref:Uncharacterized protein n=1 Tax=Mikania micrantha TaxID=192012 RepID=A0A5N6N3D4_9ASTR|nr:hypothetical protein E3N88_24464 [Mikania micrantha]
MKVVAAYLLALLGGNTCPSAEDLKNILGSVGADADDDKIELLLSQVKGKDITELIASGREKLASVPSGGGGVAVAAAAGGGGAAAPAAAAESKKEEKVEEKEESDDTCVRDFQEGCVDSRTYVREEDLCGRSCMVKGETNNSCGDRLRQKAEVDRKRG